MTSPVRFDTSIFTGWKEIFRRKSPAETLCVVSARSFVIGPRQDFTTSEPFEGISPVDPSFTGRMLNRNVCALIGVT